MSDVSTTAFKELYDNAIHWALINGPRILIAGVVFLFGQWLIRFFRKWLGSHLTKKDMHSSVRPFIQSLAIALIQILLLVVVMQIIGIQLTMFAAGVASIGVTIGLALSGTLQNFACGLLILFLKPFKVGDHIIAQAQEGIVDSIQVFYTVVITADQRMVIIPNSKLSNEVIVTIKDDGNRKFEIELKFGFENDVNQIQDIIRKSIGKISTVLTSPSPVIGISKSDADGFKIKTEAWSEVPKLDDAKSDLQREMITDLKSAGIKFPTLLIQQHP